MKKAVGLFGGMRGKIFTHVAWQRQRRKGLLYKPFKKESLVTMATWHLLPEERQDCVCRSRSQALLDER